MDWGSNGCCSSAWEKGQKVVVGDLLFSSEPHHPQPTVEILGGQALIGTSEPFIPDDEVSPRRRKPVKPIRMSAKTITKATFARFVKGTIYVAAAGRFGWPFVYFSDVSEAMRETEGVVGTEWWRRVGGATWRDERGPEAKEKPQPDHPVVHVSWNDSSAFAGRCGGRLPTEAEWRHAARDGSFLCHRSHCYRCRIAARHCDLQDTSTTHQGSCMVRDMA